MEWLVLYNGEKREWMFTYIEKQEQCIGGRKIWECVGI